MIGSYYVSAIGSAHKEKNDGICQDYSAVKKLSDNTVVAAIADGLGSAEHSDAGAKLAVESVIDHISLNISAVRCESYTDLIRQAYVNAYNATLDLAKGMQIDPRELNTTLTVAIYNGKDLYYGQCGDGGIIALTVQGEYVRVTSAAKGESFNETHPLLNGEEYWSFGLFDGQVCAFSMMTDGIFDLVCSPLLNEQPCPIYISFIRRFLDRNILAANNEKDFETLQGKISDYISSDKFSRSYNISDDKTIVGIINTDIMPALKNDDYYAEPDWKALHKNMTKRIYNVTLDDVSDKPEESKAAIADEHFDSVPTTNDEKKDDKQPSKYQRQKIIELENTVTRLKNTVTYERDRIQGKDKKLLLYGVIILAELVVIVVLSLMFIFKSDNKGSDDSSSKIIHIVSSNTQKTKEATENDSEAKTTTTTTTTQTTTTTTSETPMTTTTSTSETTELPNPEAQPQEQTESSSMNDTFIEDEHAGDDKDGQQNEQQNGPRNENNGGQKQL